MARNSFGTTTFQARKVKRKGVHAKSASSNQPNSKKYRKKYRGQGRA